MTSDRGGRVAAGRGRLGRRRSVPLPSPLRQLATGACHVARTTMTLVVVPPDLFMDLVLIAIINDDLTWGVD